MSGWNTSPNSSMSIYVAPLMQRGITCTHTSLLQAALDKSALEHSIFSHISLAIIVAAVPNMLTTNPLKTHFDDIVCLTIYMNLLFILVCTTQSTEGLSFPIYYNFF